MLSYMYGLTSNIQEQIGAINSQISTANSNISSLQTKTTDQTYSSIFSTTYFGGTVDVTNSINCDAFIVNRTYITPYTYTYTSTSYSNNVQLSGTLVNMQSNMYIPSSTQEGAILKIRNTTNSSKVVSVYGGTAKIKLITSNNSSTSFTLQAYAYLELAFMDGYWYVLVYYN